MTVLGIGTDIIHISRIQRLLTHNSLHPTLSNPHAARFTQRILHPKYELTNYQDMIDQRRSQEEIARYVAGIWSVKESIFKAMDWELQGNYKLFKQWWKYSDEHGRPIIGGEYLDWLEMKNGRKHGEKFWCSLSHDGDVLVSQVVWTRD